MENLFKQINPKLVKMLLPWIATMITALPYSDSRSHFLDRLVALIEE